MDLHEVAGRLAEAGAEVDAVARAVSRVDPGPAAFGPDSAGSLGALARALHGRCRDVVNARSTEVAGLGARLRDLADAVACAAIGYAHIDVAAARRHATAAPAAWGQGTIDRAASCDGSPAPAVWGQ